jgi:membrane fusion protein, copper/silver efflux system
LRKHTLGSAIAALAVFGFALGRVSISSPVSADAPASRPLASETLPASQDRLHEFLPNALPRRVTGVRVEVVSRQPGLRALHAMGTIGVDDSRIYRIFAGSDGRISSLASCSPGTVVHKGEKLATFYSNDLVKAQQAYFFSLQALDSKKAGKRENDIRLAEDAVRANEKILMSMGMGEAQIHEIAQKREATRDIDIVAPADGMVIAKNLVQQQRLESGTEIFRVVDFRQVWIYAAVPPGEMPLLIAGTKARVVIPQTGKGFEAVVSNSLPLVNSGAGEPQLKLEAQNPDLLLRSGMHVNVELNIAAPQGLSIPREAAVDNGFENIVYVETGNHSFEPRVVELGSAFADRISVRRGLSEGDRVAIPGHYLRDSESRTRKEPLLAAQAGYYQAPSHIR